MLRGLQRRLLQQVALLTTIGLSSKNAILIVEFAESAVDEGYLPPGGDPRRADSPAPDCHDLAGVYRRVLPLAIVTGAGPTAAWRSALDYRLGTPDGHPCWRCSSYRCSSCW